VFLFFQISQKCHCEGTNTSARTTEVHCLHWDHAYACCCINDVEVCVHIIYQLPSCVDRVYSVMERSWKVMKFEICIPGLETLWKLEKIVWIMEKSWNFRFFPKLFFADGWKVKNLGNLISHIKMFNQWGISLIVFTSPLVNFEVMELDLKSWKIMKFVFPGFRVNPGRSCS